MDISSATKRARPGLVEGEDYAVADYADGLGPRLEWLSDEPRPTQDELEAANLEASREAKRAEIRAELVSECEAVMPIWEFAYLLYSKAADSRLPALAAAARRAREREAALNKASTLEQVEGA